MYNGFLSGLEFYLRISLYTTCSDVFVLFCSRQITPQRMATKYRRLEVEAYLNRVNSKVPLSPLHPSFPFLTFILNCFFFHPLYPSPPSLHSSVTVSSLHDLTYTSFSLPVSTSSPSQATTFPSEQLMQVIPGT